jgi:Ribonuclease G/E
MRRYLHRKIEEYISVYNRPGDSVRTIESQAVESLCKTSQTSAESERRGGDVPVNVTENHDVSVDPNRDVVVRK